jgi:hypothetical protein
MGDLAGDSNLRARGGLVPSPWARLHLSRPFQSGPPSLDISACRSRRCWDGWLVKRETSRQVGMRLVELRGSSSPSFYGRAGAVEKSAVVSSRGRGTVRCHGGGVVTDSGVFPNVPTRKGATWAGDAYGPFYVCGPDFVIGVLWNNGLPSFCCFEKGPLCLQSSIYYRVKLIFLARLCNYLPKPPSAYSTTVKIRHKKTP